MLFWIGFNLFVIAFLAFDLGFFHRESTAIGIREALIWTSVCVGMALSFGVLVYFIYEYHILDMGLSGKLDLSGGQASLQYLTGYLIELSLSMDNIFAIAMIFEYFRVPRIYQHRVLFWGILGALIMRGIMILAGVALIRQFEWVIYIFGVLLIVTAVKMLVMKQEESHPDRNILVRLARRLYPVSPTLDGERFFTHIHGKRAITPLFLVLLVVESTDVMFAIDSIPAIFAVTRDPFIVYTSNVFAILGLRSLYFGLAGMIEMFRYLKYSLVFILAFVGVKMLLSHSYPIPITFSLSLIGLALVMGIAISILRARTESAR